MQTRTRLLTAMLVVCATTACGADDAAPVTPTPTPVPGPIMESEPLDDPATTAVSEECERDSDCVAYLGVCDQWFAVAAGREAADEAEMRERMETDGVSCPPMDPSGHGPTPDVVCEHGRCEQLDH